MQNLIERHPSEIRVGDRLNHAGADVEVIQIEQTNGWQRNWRFRIQYEWGSGIREIFPSDSHPFYNKVYRYESINE